jgi:hypothetical protein
MGLPGPSCTIGAVLIVAKAGGKEEAGLGQLKGKFKFFPLKTFNLRRYGGMQNT